MNYLAIFIPIFIVGMFFSVSSLFKLLYLDALSRDIKHPKLWSFIGMGGNNGSGLLLYLIHRRNYPIKNQLSREDKYKFKKYKKIIYIGITMMTVGVIGIVILIALTDLI